MTQNALQGTVFDIKEFAVHDGPGLRQTVFMKGCPLRCNWCHNPEGLSPKPQIMVSAGCRHCGKCAGACKHDICIGCGECVRSCPERLRHVCGRVYTSGELAQALQRNTDYYASCGGGVTFSGGEPLMQWAFVCEVLDLLPGVHKAVETSGYAPEAAFSAVMERVDLVMMDFKIFDDAMHRRYTGVSNLPIRRNLELLKGSDVPFILRIPVIPGVNDTRENYESTASLLGNAKRLLRVELLPYHKTAGAKYGMVRMEYQPLFDAQALPRLMPEVFHEHGIPCIVM